jgi:hypothetical protein
LTGSVALCIALIWRHYAAASAQDGRWATDVPGCRDLATRVSLHFALIDAEALADAIDSRAANLELR